MSDNETIQKIVNHVNQLTDLSRSTTEELIKITSFIIDSTKLLDNEILKFHIWNIILSAIVCYLLAKEIF